MVKRRRKIKIRIARWWALPLTFMVGLSVFVIAAALYRPPAYSPQSKLPAAEYFEIVNATTDSAQFMDSNKTILKVSSLLFTIKPIKGDVHNLHIESWAGSEPWDALYLKQGEVSLTGFVELRSPYGYITEKETRGFPITIDVTSTEAEGEITFYL